MQADALAPLITAHNEIGHENAPHPPTGGHTDRSRWRCRTHHGSKAVQWIWSSARPSIRPCTCSARFRLPLSSSCHSNTAPSTDSVQKGEINSGSE